MSDLNRTYFTTSKEALDFIDSVIKEQNPDEVLTKTGCRVSPAGWYTMPQNQLNKVKVLRSVMYELIRRHKVFTRLMYHESDLTGKLEIHVTKIDV
jgi:hypothetical protein